MIKLNTKDIIKRATQLADLENSDFISWNENLQIMNEGYQKIYQKLINHGDKTYMKTCLLVSPISVGSNEIHYNLPNDFFQLYSLTDVNGNRCIVKKSINDPISSLRYDIVNNELVIYGNNNITMRMSYYPIPQTLTIKADGVKFDMPAAVKTAQYVDVCDKKIVYTSGNNVIVYNIETETSETLNFNLSTITSTISNFIACKYGVLIVSSDRTSKYIDYTSSDVASSGNDAFFITRDKKLLYASSTGYIKEYIDGGTTVNVKNIGDFFNVLQDDNGGIGYIDDYSMDTGYFVKYVEKKIVYEFSLNDKYLERLAGEVDSDIGYIMDNKYVSSKVLYNLFSDRPLIEGGVIGINKIDSDTGYGYTHLSGEIKGIFDNTEIDYPNNLFIQLIAYYMAIQYKSKQNADCQGLIALYTNAEEQFYDSIGRDDYQYVRIQNVY